MAGKIFISYRRADSDAHALGLSQALARAFGERNVFIDVDMHAGARFPEVLKETLAKCKVMLVVIGPGWATARDSEGNPRLWRPDDWVRLEITEALARRICVIPVLVGGAELPARDDLLEPIRPLLDHQATRVETKSYRTDLAALVGDIRRELGPSRPWPMYAAAVALLATLVAGGVAYLNREPAPNCVGLPQTLCLNTPECAWINRRPDLASEYYCTQSEPGHNLEE